MNGKPLSELYEDLPPEKAIAILFNEIDKLQAQNATNVDAAERRFAAAEGRSVWIQRTIITTLSGLVIALATLLLTR